MISPKCTCVLNKMDVVVFGSANVDFFCYLPRLPKPGETIHGNKFSNGFGGKGANQCVAAAKLGAKSSLIAKLGEDIWGNNYLNHLKEEGVNVDFVEKCSNETTGVAQISVADNGENCIAIVMGANNLLSSDDVMKAQELFSNSKILICQLETPMKASIDAMRAFKGISILNAAPALTETPKELLEFANILCVNETEASLMSGSNEILTLTDAKIVSKKLIEIGAQTVIITLGANGAVYVEKYNPDSCIHVPVQKIAKVVDTTGAGDAFLGALAFYMAKYPKSDLHQQIGAANAIAAYSVQYPGTQSSFPSADEVNNLNETTFAWKEI